MASHDIKYAASRVLLTNSIDQRMTTSTRHDLTPQTYRPCIICDEITPLSRILTSFWQRVGPIELMQYAVGLGVVVLVVVVIGGDERESRGRRTESRG